MDCRLPGSSIHGIFQSRVVEWVAIAFSGRTLWKVLKKLELELLYDPAIPLLSIHTEETRIERDTCTPMFTVYNSQDMEAT